MDAVRSFIDFLRTKDIPPADPSEIVADDTWRRYHIVGDKHRKSSGSYILATDGKNAWGGAIGFSTGGGWQTFDPPSDLSDLSPEQRTERTRERERRKKEQEQVRKDRETLAMAEAKEKYDRSNVGDGLHPYLVRKKINPPGIREKDGSLILPMWCEDKFKSIQTIAADGEKLVHEGISTKGCYWALSSKDDPKDSLIVCEGFATAATLRAWFPNVPIVLSYFANNLLDVSCFFRTKYPEANMVVCADNDAWQRLKPTDADRVYVGPDSPKNTGVVKGKEAALAINGACIWPDFGDIEGRPTDFNDADILGQENIWKPLIEKALTTRLVKVKPPPPKVQYSDWEEQLLVKKVDRESGQIWLKENSLNYSTIIRNHPMLNGVFAFDEFALCAKVVQPPPWVIHAGLENEFEVHILSEYDERQTDYYLQKLGYGLKGAMDKTRGAIQDAAMDNKFHPPRQHLDALVWDGTPRLDTWLADYMAARKDDPDYVSAVGRAWMIAAVKRLYEPGCTAQNMLVLDGDQGVGKSECLKILSTFGWGGEEKTYFTDSFNIRNCTESDELMKLTGSVIVEVAEMAGFSKADQDNVKRFITSTTDKYRAPYGRTVLDWPRQFVLAGTFNPNGGLFTDATGLRRFWCVRVGRRQDVDLEGLKSATQQLWAEATHRYKAGESTLLSENMYTKAAVAAETRRMEDQATGRVLDIVRGETYITVPEVMKSLGIEVLPGHGNQREARAIMEILRINGWSTEQRQVSGRRQTVWVPPREDVPVREEEIEI